MNAVAYLRVSTDGQVDKYGLPAQRKDIENYAKRNGIRILEWYVEEGVSGAKEDRPEFNKILYGDVQNPPVEAVIVAKSDRVARDIYLYYAFKHELQKKSIQLISVSEDFGAMGDFAPIMEAMLVAMAQVERTNITRRTSGGRKVKAYDGGYSGGRIPYGYECVDHEYVINPQEAEAVKLIFRLKGLGCSVREIIRELEARGCSSRSGGVFAPSTIQSILENRKLYEGWYKYGKGMEWVRGRHEAILKEEEQG